MEDVVIKWVTFGIAVVGCVLGVVNYVTELFRRKPRASASVRDCYTGHDSDRHVCAVIHVINTGECPIYFEQFGLNLRGKKGFFPVKPQRVDGSEVPTDLLPGQAVDVVVDEEVWTCAEADGVDRAFARISTGKEFYTERLDRAAIARYRASSEEHLAKLKDLFHALDSYEAFCRESRA
jgi:hypothetical protein